MWKMALTAIVLSLLSITEVHEVNHLTSGVSESISRMEFQQRLFPARKTANLR
jgi:hypothetical protein